MTRDGRQPTLWAISDLHTGHTGNKPVTESLYPSTPDDWLIVAGDVGERTDEIRWALDLLRKRFAKVIWVPGNHELWTTNRDPMQIFGKARYDYLVNMCDEMGVITPEHPFPVWTEEGGPATIVPMFLLYDYTFLPQGAATKAEGLAIARERNVVGTDEFLLSAEPYATRDAWCRDRVAYTRKRLEELDWMTPNSPGEPLPDGPRTLRCDVLPRVRAVVRHHGDRRLAHPLQRDRARCTGTCTSRAPRGTTGYATKRSPSGIRESGAAASHIDGYGRYCPTRSMRPAISTSSADTSRSPRRCASTPRRCSSASGTGSHDGRRDAALRCAARRCDRPSPPPRCIPTRRNSRHCPKKSR